MYNYKLGIIHKELDRMYNKLGIISEKLDRMYNNLSTNYFRKV